MSRIALLIPCYNEEKTIEKVVRDYRAALPEAKIYVYNNNSTDKTFEIATRLAKRDSKIGSAQIRDKAKSALNLQ